eukprot:jgi/Tetstr1/442491/TSEL_030591.t1
MIDFACVSSTSPTWSDDPRWCTLSIAATEAEQGKLEADHASSAPVQGVHRYYPFVVEDRGRLGKSALTVVYIFAVLLVVSNFHGGPSASTSCFLRGQSIQALRNFLACQPDEFRRHLSRTRQGLLQRVFACVHGEGTTILDRQGRRYSTRLLGAPHLDDIERPVHQVWLRSPAFRGTTEVDMWRRLAEGLRSAYDQPQPSEAATDRPAATPADVLALVGVRAWAEYEANTDADDAIICPPTRTLLALLEVRGVWKARRSADSNSSILKRRAYSMTAICTGPLADLELPMVEQLAGAIAATISQRTNTPPELQHA